VYRESPHCGGGWGDHPHPEAALSPLVEEARDELFSHILRSGVIGAPPDQRREWLDETMAYLGNRYPELRQPALGVLRGRAERFITGSP
jgi:hypothetical protein